MRRPSSAANTLFVSHAPLSPSPSHPRHHPHLVSPSFLPCPTLRRPPSPHKHSFISCASTSSSTTPSTPSPSSSSSPTATATAAAPHLLDETPVQALQRLPLKRLISWAALVVALLCLRSFFPVIVATFILSYVTNSVVRATGRARLPRRATVGVFYSVILTAITTFSLMTIPTVVRESQYFVTTLQSDNPYVYVANSLRKALGDDLTTKVEAYVIYSTRTNSLDVKDVPSKNAVIDTTPQLLPSSSSSSSKPPTLLAPGDNAAQEDQKWTEERSRRLGMLLQKSLRSYIASTISLVSKIVSASTKFIFKAILSLIFSFMIMWDLPLVTRGVRKLRHSKLAFMYHEIAPIMRQFGSVLGKSFEAQGLIALVNTSLTTLGLIGLGIPGIGFLSLVTLLCSFIPVAGVFVSTVPMCIIALNEFGLAKALAVILMVIVVHLVEAYVLNPQIYSAHLHLHPLMVLAVLYIAEHSYGIPGLLLAVPVAVYVLRTVMNEQQLQAGAHADDDGDGNTQIEQQQPKDSVEVDQMKLAN